MKLLHQTLFCITLFCAIATLAQDFSSFATGMPKMKAVFSKILADTPEFSADAVVGQFATNGVILGKMPINFSLTSERMRQEIDVMGMALPTEWREATRKLHMDKSVVITQTDTKKVYLLFPEVQAYSEYQIPDEVLYEMGARAGAVNIQRVELGQEMIENHLCIQTKLTVTETNHSPEYAIMRCATDLQKFPIRLDIYTPTSTTRFIFEKVQLSKPDASLFEVPTNYVEYPDVTALSNYAKGKFQDSANCAAQ